MKPTIKSASFLADVLVCSLGAFGGPEAHYGIFLDQLVSRKNYLSEEELLELMAVTTILPGPSSTQTITAIGYRLGGYRLALLTLLVWAMPAIGLMTFVSFLSDMFASIDPNLSFLRYLAPMAVAFMAVAAYRLGQKVLKESWMWLLFVVSVSLSVGVRNGWMFVSVIALGALTSLWMNRTQATRIALILKPQWWLLGLFGFIAITSYGLAQLRPQLWIQLFDRFYRYGYLVIGGGQVVIPYMYTELVEQLGYLSHEAFLRGFGLVQGLPGPMFSFSAYVGGMAAIEGSTFGQVLAALISGIAIFLPGTLLIFFVLPLWDQLRQHQIFQRALTGITISATALIAASTLVFLQKNGFTWDVLTITVMSALAIWSKKVWIPILVLAVMMVGLL